MYSKCFKNNFLAKLNLWKVNNPDILAHSLSSHHYSVSQSSGLFRVWKCFKKFLLFTKYLNASKEIFSKIQPLKGVPWYFAHRLSLHHYSSSRIVQCVEVFLLFTKLPYVLKMAVKTKLNLWNMNSPDFLVHSLSSHGHSVSQNSGLFSVWNYILRNFYFLQNFPYIGKTPLLKVEQTLIFWLIVCLHMAK